MKIVFSWDDGAVEDAKLMKMHIQYGIPGIFFVPTINREGRDVISDNLLKELITSQFISIGGHTYNHTYLTTIPLQNVYEEVEANKKCLSYLDSNLRHFCLPGGRYNESINKEVFKSFFSIRTAETMNFKKPKNNIVRPTFHFYRRGNKSLIANALRHGNIIDALYVLFNYRKDYFELIKRIIDRKSKKDVVICIWGHSWELEKYNLWDELFSLFEYVNKTYHDSIVSYDDLFNL